MGNPIRYSELISPDGSIKDLISQLEETNRALEQLMANAKANAGVLKAALSSASPSGAEGRREIAELSGEVERLAAKARSLEKALRDNAAARRAAARALAEEARLKEAAARTNISAAARELTQAKVQTMSYNELKKAYADLKTQINEMTASTAEETRAREEASAVAKRVYEQMTMLQEATGKHSLSVGNYAKSWNGLNLAFQQIVRETPNMAMGANMFFLAISNNIPILTDQIKIAKAKYKQDLASISALKAEAEAMKNAGRTGAAYKLKIEEISAAQSKAIPVGKQILSSLFSWQTAMILGVTLLTMYGGKLIDAIFKTDQAKDAQKEYNRTLSEFSQSGAAAAAKVSLLYEVSTDLNASIEDRIDATKALQDMYPEVFGNLSEEEIMAGNAKAAYDKLAESIFKTAMAEAAMQKIKDASVKSMEAKMKITSAEQLAASKGYASVEDMYTNEKQVSTSTSPTTGISSTATYRTQEVRDAWKSYREGTKLLKEAERERDIIKKIFDDNDLYSFLSGDEEKRGSNKRREDKVKEMLSPLYDYEKYWRQTRKAMIDFMKEGEAKEIEAARFKYDTEIEDLMDFRDAQEAIMIEIAEIDGELQRERSSDAREALKERRNGLVKDLKLNESGVIELNRLILAKTVERETAITEITDKYRADRVKKKMSEIDDNLKISKHEINALKLSADEKAQMAASAEIEAWKARIRIMESNIGIYSEKELAIARATLNDLIANFPVPKESWFQKALGLNEKEFKAWARFSRELGNVAGNVISNISAVIDAYKRQAEAARDAAQAQVDAANTVYEAELEAYSNGYANNVEYARRELELKKQKRAEAQAEVEKYTRIQQRLDSLSQVSSMITAAASLYKASAPLGPLGVGIATAATAAMFASFAAAKIQAAQMSSGVEMYGEGMSEFIGYGGSHASGKDVDFGRKRDGTRRRVERGEMVAVFNARNTRKYGPSAISEIVESINKGTFENTYIKAFGGAGGFLVNMPQAQENPRIGAMADDISAIRKNGETVRYALSEGVWVERRRNRTRKIKVS